MMDEKTEELRDIFLSVSDEGSVTELQSEDRGTLLGESGGDLAAVVEDIREKFGFELSLSQDERLRLIEEFYDGADDDQLAATLELDTETVFRARMELHLLREDEPRLDAETVEQIRERNSAPEELAAELGVSEQAIQRCRAILDARERSRRVSHRFRTAYEEQLTDTDLTDHLAADATEDGLDGATEGAETNTDF